jgi:triosephosphate isomerase (TIM)
MRVPLVAGNWKMYMTIAETRQLISEMAYGLSAVEGVQKVICPPFTALLAASALLEGTDIELGAQNMFWEDEGAYTGEVSPPMISELCSFVIIGHSERRTYFGEDNKTVNKKVRSALEHGLKAIVCVGETIEQREADQTREVVTRQVEEGLNGIKLADHGSLVIAYEPVWAIGTGRASTPEDAGQVIHDFIRARLKDMFGNGVMQDTRVLYGGSVKADNAEIFFNHPEIDGALVGGASLKSQEFINIVKAAHIKFVK